MNKRQAKRKACWIVYQEIHLYFDGTGGEIDPKVGSALRELQQEILRRSGKLEEKPK